jgi:plasmid maintenance system antidote protein VapI
MLMERHELTSESLARKLGCSDAAVRGLLAGTVPVDASLDDRGQFGRYVT